jgi:hypothetical protein
MGEAVFEVINTIYSPAYVPRGLTWDGTTIWNIDGANVTDNSALGAAPAYFNIAGYDEVQINYGNNDVKAQTGGVRSTSSPAAAATAMTEPSWRDSSAQDSIPATGHHAPGWQCSTSS